MCVIAVKTKNISPISDEILQQCWDSNPHGAGVAVIKHGTKKIIMKKGLMTKQLLLDFCHQNIEEKDTAVYHFRLATSGNINAEMCHPFPINSGAKNTVSGEFTGKIEFLFHNGVVGHGTRKKSDTAILAEQLQSKNPKSKNLVLQYLAKSNKFVVMTPTTLRLYGSWIKDEQATGALFSNSSYKYKLWILNDEGAITQPTCPSCNSERVSTIDPKNEIFMCKSCEAMFDGYRNLISDPIQKIAVA